MSQFFKAGETDTPAIDYGEGVPFDIRLSPDDTLELADDGTVVFMAPVMKFDIDGNFLCRDMTQPKVTFKFSNFVIFESEHRLSSIFALSTDGEAELRYVAQESPLGQALMARGLVRVEPA